MMGVLPQQPHPTGGAARDERFRQEPPSKEALDRVTFHAVTRYVQRILGIRVAKQRWPEETALAHCAAAGVEFDTVRAAIMCPAVQSASEHHLKQVQTPEFAAFFSPAGDVTTITRFTHGRRAHHRCIRERAEAHKHPSRSERRRMALSELE